MCPLASFQKALLRDPGRTCSGPAPFLAVSYSWANEYNSFLATPSGEGGVLAEEAVPWVDCIHRLLLSKGNDGFNV